MYGFLLNFSLSIHTVIAIHISLNFFFVERNGKDGLWVWNLTKIPLFEATCLLIKVHYELVTRAFDLKFSLCGRLRPIFSKQLFILVKLILNSRTNQATILLHSIPFKIEPMQQLAFDYLTHSENRFVPCVQYVLVEALRRISHLGLVLKCDLDHSCAGLSDIHSYAFLFFFFNLIHACFEFCHGSSCCSSP